MASLVGKWKLHESENFDEFLKALVTVRIPANSDFGVSMAWRKLASTSKPVVEIKNEGDDWSMKTSTLLKTSEIKFQLGKEFEENRIDGVKVKTVINLEGDKLVQKQFGDKEVSIVRELDNGELKVTCSLGDVVSVRKYVKEQ